MAGVVKSLTTSHGLVTAASGGLVDYADVQATAAASVLLGRGAGSGAGTVQEITLGTGLTMTGTVLSASAASYTDEQAQDAVGAMTANSSRVSLTYVDATPSLTADLVADSITAGYLHATATDVLFGRSSAGAGAGQEIACTAFARSLLDDPDAATARATLGAGTGSGTVTAVTASSPLASSGGTAPNITITLTAGDIPALDASKITTGVFPVARGGTGQVSPWGFSGLYLN